jgi:hypothetical protein
MSAARVGAAGLVLVATLVLSFLVAYGAPEAIRSDEAILDWYLDSANQLRFLLGAMIGGVGVLALLVFVVGLRRLLADAGAAEGLVELGYAAGVVLVAVVAVATGIGSSVAATLAFTDELDLDPDTARIVLTIGNIWLPAFAGIPGALYLAATSLACRRTGLLPGWLAWLGLALAPLAFAAFPGFAINTYLVAAWILLASVVLVRRRPPRRVLATRTAASHNS